MNGRDPVPHVARIIIDELLSDPRASALVELAQSANELLAAFQKRSAPASGSTSDAQRPSGPTARQRLLFGERDRLTSALVRKRRAALAALCHPDAGGSADVMATLNTAADELLAQCAHADPGSR